MKGVRYRFAISSEKCPSGTVPAKMLRDILDFLIEGSARSLRLAIEGKSLKKGRIPDWVQKSVKFTVVGLEAGSTNLVVEAPTLEETAPDKVDQRDLWYTVPKPGDTAITLLSKSVRDSVTGQQHSERYDKGFLQTLLSAKDVLGPHEDKLTMSSEDRPDETFSITSDDIRNVEQLKESIPKSHPVVLSGRFDIIQHSKRRFRLVLRDGREVPGRADISYVGTEQMRELWGTDVTIKGILHFKASGNPRLLDAQVIKPSEAGEEVFDTLPEHVAPVQLVEQVRKRKTGPKILETIWGQWPGDESIEEILTVLKNVGSAD